MNTLARMVSFGLLSSVVACGGSPGSVSGSIHGVSYSINDAISASVTSTSNGVTSHAGVILMASASNLCSHVNANSEPPNVKSLFFLVADFNGTAVNAPTTGGTYTIFVGNGTTAPPPHFATSNAGVTDATCTSITADAASGMTGTVTLSSVSGNTFDGSFDVTMDSGDHVTGSFSPEACPGLQNVIGSTMKPACM